MDKSAFDASKKFLITYLKGKVIEYETLHPWRKPWEFVVLHSFRVHSYAEKIMRMENFKLNENEIYLTRAAAILHDIGRTEERKNHAENGADIVENWLSQNNDFNIDNTEKERLIYLIRNHSDKGKKNDDICLSILQDADVLDEIGALSIFMASNWVDKENAFFFNQLLDRVITYEIPFCEKGYALLQTNAAKKILKEKQEYIEKFIIQLKSELEGTEEVYKLIFEQ
jgi:putative nucleotidyltransferase with HDIG domain